VARDNLWRRGNSSVGVGADAGSEMIEIARCPGACRNAVDGIAPAVGGVPFLEPAMFKSVSNARNIWVNYTSRITI